VASAHVKGYFVDKQQSQLRGGMTYQLGMAMLALKKKQKDTCGSGQSGSLVGIKAADRPCAAIRSTTHGSRGPFSQGPFPLSWAQVSPAKRHPQPHLWMTSFVLRGHQCAFIPQDKPNLILFCSVPHGEPACPPLPAAKADTRLAMCDLCLSMQNDVCCGASTVAMPAIGALYAADWTSANHLLDRGMPLAHVHAGTP
jgi:hypothetical protein